MGFFSYKHVYFLTILSCFIFCFVHDVAAFVCGTDVIPYGDKNYQTVQIGTQCWFKENLNVGQKILAGSTLPSDPVPELNQPNTVQKWCYDDLEGSCTNNGGLYTWAEANRLPYACNLTSCVVPSQNQGICPSGWHIPTDDEYKTLEMSLGMTQAQADGQGWRGTNQGTQLKIPLYGGTNTSGFTVLMPGYRYADGGAYYSVNNASIFVTASEYSATYEWRRYMYPGSTAVDRYIQHKLSGMSVRCVKDPFSVSSITTNAASGITFESATLNAAVVDTGGDNPERFIQYTTTSGSYAGANECVVGEGTTGAYSCQITDLEPETTYYFKAKAVNDTGTAYGNELFFTTLPLPDTTIQDPTPQIMEDVVSDGYMTITQGSLTSAHTVQTVVNVTVQDSIFEALFPENTMITGDGDFNFQSFIASNVTQNVRDEQPTSRAAIQIGIPNEQLSFSEDVTIQVYVGSAFNNQELDIFYQQEGETTWNPHSTPTCTVSAGYCTFTTDHATIYTINGVHQATGDTPISINTKVQETLSMDCYDTSDSNTTVQLGTIAHPATVTAGTPAVGRSRCDVTTNADQGYYLTLTDNDATHATLTHTDPHTATIYEIQDLTPYTEATPNIQSWSAPTTKGLGFSVINFPETNTTHNTFDGLWEETDQCPEGTSADTNNYTGIPQSPQTIAAVTSYQSTQTSTDLCYKVDVPPSQPSGQYTGSVTFTATSDASGYYQ